MDKITLSLTYVIIQMIAMNYTPGSTYVLRKENQL